MVAGRREASDTQYGCSGQPSFPWSRLLLPLALVFSLAFSGRGYCRVRQDGGCFKIEEHLEREERVLPGIDMSASCFEFIKAI